MSPMSFANAMASRGRGMRLLAISSDLSPSESSSAAQVRYLSSPAWREGAEQPQLRCQTVGENDANRPGRWPLSNSLGHAGQWYSLAWLEYGTDAGTFKPEPVGRYSGEVQTNSLPVERAPSGASGVLSNSSLVVYVGQQIYVLGRVTVSNVSPRYDQISQSQMTIPQ